MSNTFDVAIVGATGFVGETMVQVLEQRGFPVGRLHVIASERSAGRHVAFRGEMLAVEPLAAFDFRRCDIALFSAGARVSAEYAPRAVEAGAVVVDNTSQFRDDADVPLVVPEVNPHCIAEHTVRGIIASPNCSTIQLVVALKPLYDAFGIERINVATYQAVSDAGRGPVERLREHSRQLLSGLDPIVSGNSGWVAFNAVPQIDVFEENGYTREEMKMVRETRKLLEDDNIMVNPTAVRVPVFVGHAEAVHIETRTKVTLAAAQRLLNSAPGVVVMDGRDPGMFPTPAIDAADRDAVYVGRVREDISHPRGLDLWVVADNLRKGAALNSVQIAEVLVHEFM